MPSDLDIAYAAGIFDGEGSMAAFIGGGKYRRSLTYCASVWQSQYDLLNWLQKHFDGGVYGRKGAGYGKNSRKVAGEWRITGIKAAAFLRTIRPHLIVRASDVDELLHIWDIRMDRDKLVTALAARKERLSQKRNKL